MPLCGIRYLETSIELDAMIIITKVKREKGWRKIFRVLPIQHTVLLVSLVIS